MEGALKAPSATCGCCLRTVFNLLRPLPKAKPKEKLRDEGEVAVKAKSPALQDL